MRLNGMLHMIRHKDATYRVTYTPVGVPSTSCPSRIFPSWIELERFLAGPLRVEWREILTALDALSRHGNYCLYEVRLSEAEIREHGLGSARTLSTFHTGLFSHAERFAET